MYCDGVDESEEHDDKEFDGTWFYNSMPLASALKALSNQHVRRMLPMISMGVWGNEGVVIQYRMLPDKDYRPTQTNCRLCGRLHL